MNIRNVLVGLLFCLFVGRCYSSLEGADKQEDVKESSCAVQEEDIKKLFEKMQKLLQSAELLSGQTEAEKIGLEQLQEEYCENSEKEKKKTCVIL